MVELTQIQGKASMRLDGVLTQTIGAVYETIECFNTIQAQRGDCTAIAGLVGSLTYGGNNIVQGEIQLGINADFVSNAALDIIAAVNGVVYDDNPLTIRGLGVGKSVSVFWISQTDFNPGDVLTIMAKNADIGDLTINFSRSLFAMKVDG